MTREEFDVKARTDHCHGCGGPVTLEHNPNNNATQVVCGNALCVRQRRPWGLVLNLKTTNRKTREPLPNGDTTDDVWERWGNVCFVCGGTKAALALLGIGRQAHHVLPYAQHGHEGPVVPICTHCHPAVSDRQRLYWFMQRLVTKNGESALGSRAGVPAPGVSRHPLRAAGEAAAGSVEELPDDDAHG